MIAPDTLRAATWCPHDAAATFAPLLSEACASYAIDDSRQRLAAFLAQVGHESVSLRHVAEVWGPTPAQSRYEGRKDLGNTEPGDGFRYRGRGLIQCTGRANYRNVSRWLAFQGAPDFERRPEELEAPRWAAWSAAAWWRHNGCNELADSGDFEALTRRINGGLNGLADRQARYEAAKAALATVAIPAPAAPAAPALDPMPAGEAPDWQPPPPPEQTMPLAPIVAAVLPSIVEQIPKLGRIFGSGSQVSERNIKAAEIVVDAVTKATGAVNAQQAVERLASDPAAVQAATKAIDSVWYELTEAGGGGIDGARKADAAYSSPGGQAFWRSPAFWLSAWLVAMPFLILVDLLFVHPDQYSEALRTQIVTAALALWVVVGAYWLGTSASSQRKTELMAPPKA